LVSVQEVAKDLLFDKALKKAKGEKVKDDVSKIKKTIKRKQSSKAKSQREWYVSTTNTHSATSLTHLLNQSIPLSSHRKERITSLKEKQEARQRRREENIKKYRGKNKAKVWH